MYKDWKQFKKAWVKALRSGDYRQGQGKLVVHDAVTCTDQFCCLGVAANLLIKKGHKGEWFESYGEWMFGVRGGKRSDIILTEVAVTPDWLKERLREDDLENRLAKMNDNGMSFDQIADHIERL